MAGYVKLLRSIWQDPDFRALDAAAQRLYLLLISQQDVSAVGVLATTTGRWATLSANTSIDEIRAALLELEMAKFVVVDPETEEVLVRTYVTHDEAWRSPNGRASLRTAYSNVISAPLCQHIASSFERLPNNPLDTPAAPAAQDATKGATRGAASPQQPSTINHQPSTSSRAQQPAAPPGSREGAQPARLPAAAAAAADEAFTAWVQHRIGRDSVDNPAGLSRKLGKDRAIEWNPKVNEYLHAHPNADAREILRNVYRLNAAQALAALEQIRRADA